MRPQKHYFLKAFRSLEKPPSRRLTTARLLKQALPVHGITCLKTLNVSGAFLRIMGDCFFTTTGAGTSGRSTGKTSTGNNFPRQCHRISEITTSTTGAKFWWNFCPSVLYGYLFRFWNNSPRFFLLVWLLCLQSEASCSQLSFFAYSGAWEPLLTYNWSFSASALFSPHWNWENVSRSWGDFLNYNKPGKIRSPLEKVQKSEIADFCPLSWSNAPEN